MSDQPAGAVPAAVRPPRDRPLVALVVELGAGAVLRPLVRAIAGYADVRALGRCASLPDAALASGPVAAFLAPEDVPVATWHDGEVVVAGESISVPLNGLDVRSVRPYGTLVRRRWRERLGLPEHHVVVLDDLPEADRPEALRTCAAAVVGAADLPLALALGTPVVTDARSAVAAGAIDDVHVALAIGTDPAALAAELARDDARAARLGLTGRRLVEQTLDLGSVARHVLAALARADPARPPASFPRDPASRAEARLETRLRELHTPVGSEILLRVADATALLTGAAP